MWTKSAVIVATLATLVAYYVIDKKDEFPFLKLYEYTTPVDTKYGKVIGMTATSREGREYYQFLGLPFAKPPVGSLRFAFPQAPEKWDGIRYADKMPPDCLQLEVLLSGEVRGQEDCLYLNVYTPKLNKESKSMPVLIYIHGGLFHGGSQSFYKGKYFMDEDIVLVTITYRVGALGFLSTGDKIVRGNNGLRDQIMALKWVQENIHYFGGDPKRVTLSGESAGSSSVHLHLLSSQSKGLFHKAILQSGTALRNYAMTNDPQAQAKHFGAKFGCPTNSTETLIKCLREIDGRNLVMAHMDATAIVKDDFSLFVPIVEKVKDNQAFLIDHPFKLSKEGKLHRVPVIIGINAAEGLLYTSDLIRNEATLNDLDDPIKWKSYLPSLLGYDKNIPNKDTIAMKIRDFYFGQKSPSNPQQFQNLTNLFGDKLYNFPGKVAIKLLSKHTPVYAYYFTHRTWLSIFDIMINVKMNHWIPVEIQVLLFALKDFIFRQTLGYLPPFYGASHGDELSLLYNINFLTLVTKGSQDYNLSRDMVKLWVDFMRDETKMAFRGQKWLPANTPGYENKYLELCDPGGFIDEPFTQRTEFWNKLNLTLHGENVYY